MSDFPNALLKQAEAAASEGTPALRRFWGRLNADGLKLLLPDRARLKALAIFADAGEEQERKDPEL